MPAGLMVPLMWQTKSLEHGSKPMHCGILHLGRNEGWCATGDHTLAIQTCRPFHPEGPPSFGECTRSPWFIQWQCEQRRIWNHMWPFSWSYDAWRIIRQEFGGQDGRYQYRGLPVVRSCMRFASSKVVVQMGLPWRVGMSWGSSSLDSP
jgi:hypothetical protein